LFVITWGMLLLYSSNEGTFHGCTSCQFELGRAVR
jgi:hypothetical protein